MKKKSIFDRTRNFLSSFLVLISGVILYLAPFATSKFRGYITGTRTDIDFNVNIFGNWVETRIFYNWATGIDTGDAFNIGSYFSAIIPLVSIALVLSFFGMMFVWSQFDWRGKEKTDEEKIHQEKIFRVFGASLSIIGGSLALISLILFAVFESTINQPYDHFPSNNTPNVHLTFWFYFTVICFLLYIASGIFTMIKIYKKPTIEAENNLLNVEEKIVDLEHYAKLIVFDEKMKNYDEYFHKDFTNNIKEDDNLKLFQEIIYQLQKSENNGNNLDIISSVLVKLKFGELLKQLNWLISQIKNEEHKALGNKLLLKIQEKNQKKEKLDD